MCIINQRAALVLGALETAAAVDAEARDVWERFQQQRREGLNEIAVALSRKTDRLRYDEETITDTLWMLTPDAYLRLVRDAGWSVERFQDWLTDVLLRLLLADESSPGYPRAAAASPRRARADPDRNPRPRHLGACCSCLRGARRPRRSVHG